MRGRFYFGVQPRVGDGGRGGRRRGPMPCRRQAGCRPGSGRVDVEGVEPGREFGLQGVVDRPVAVQPGHAGQGGGADLYRIMCLAPGRCACVTVVEM